MVALMCSRAIISRIPPLKAKAPCSWRDGRGGGSQKCSFGYTYMVVPPKGGMSLVYVVVAKSATPLLIYPQNVAHLNRILLFCQERDVL
jgi:hypothetical protein